MAVLRVGARLEVARLRGQIALAPAVADELHGLLHRVLGNAQRVGTHVGDEAHGAHAGDLHALVQLLRGLHRALGLKAELAGRLLLQGRGDERRRGLLVLLALFDGIDAEVCRLKRRENRVRLLLVRDLDLAAAVAVERRAENTARALGCQARIDRPVFLGLEFADLLLTVDDDAQRDRLHAPGGKAAADRFREERTQRIADEAVENAARLLGVDEIEVDRARVRHALRDAGLCDLVEGNAVHIACIEPENIGQMPRDRLALTVGVGREVDGVGFLRRLLQLGNELFLALDDRVLRFKIVFHVHAQPCLRQVAHVAHRGDDLIIAAEVFFDRFRLCGRLNDDELGHISSSPLSVFYAVYAL